LTGFHLFHTTVLFGGVFSIIIRNLLVFYSYIFYFILSLQVQSGIMIAQDTMLTMRPRADVFVLLSIDSCLHAVAVAGVKALASFRFLFRTLYTDKLHGLE